MTFCLSQHLKLTKCTPITASHRLAIWLSFGECHLRAKWQCDPCLCMITSHTCEYDLCAYYSPGHLLNYLLTYLFINFQRHVLVAQQHGPCEIHAHFPQDHDFQRIFSLATGGYQCQMEDLIDIRHCRTEALEALNPNTFSRHATERIAEGGWRTL